MRTKKFQIPRTYFSFILLILVLTYTTLCLAQETNSKTITDEASPIQLSNPSKKADDGAKYNVSSTGHDSNTSHAGEKHGSGAGGHGHSKGLVVASWNYHEVRDPLIFTVILVMAALLMVVYHHLGFLSRNIPESCILIVLGIIFGGLIYATGASANFPTFFKPHEFFIFLLPPIILEAAFSLHDRTFIENIGSILLFAVLGTVLACVFVGCSLFGLAKAGAMGSIADLSFVEVMVFASLIVAVDPVAVLAVFNEIGVNHVLYFLVFGESLLNDGVTVVLYKVFQAYNVMDEINGAHIVLGIVKFFVVCVGGLMVGVLAGVVSAIATKYATKVKVAQPLIIYTMAYLGFLVAELFEFSGIICMIGCGITQKHYAFNNIGDKSKTTINYFTKVISTACETIIFMFLGLSIVNDNHDWHTGFTLWTIVLCNVFRFIIIYGLSFLINRFDSSRVRKISLDEQFMIAYGGLRGAVCFSLVALLHPEEFPSKNMFVTTTIVVILFTVFVQGTTIKPLVDFLQIRLAPEKSKTMYKELHEHVTDHLMAGMEEIIGDHGKNHLREQFKYWDRRTLQPLLMVAPDPCDAQLKEFYEHLVLKEHYNHMKVSNAKQVEKMPEFPHIATELFLRGVLSPPTLADTSGDMEGGPSQRSPSIASTGPTPTVTVREPHGGATFDLGDEEVALRSRGSRSRSQSQEKDQRGSIARPPSFSASPDISTSELRSLLKQKHNSRIARYDRNLTVVQDFQSEFRKKSDKNYRLQRLSSQDVPSNKPVLATQLSWCEAESDACAQRRNLSAKGNNSRPKHAITMDLQHQGRQATIDPSDFSSSVVVPRLGSVIEEKEKESEDELDKSVRSSTDDDIDDDSNESQPMIGGGGEGETIKMKKRKSRQSSKYKLERQGGMEDSQAGSQLAVALKNLNGGGDGGGEVKVEIEDGSGSAAKNNDDSSKV